MKFSIEHRYQIAVHYRNICISKKEFIGNTLEYIRMEDLYRNVELTALYHNKVNDEMIDEFCKSVYDTIRLILTIETAERWKGI